MEQRAFGPSGLKLSLVGLGTNNFGGRIDLEASRKVIHKALDLGVTHFDTADVYGNSGGSEEILGKVLGPRRSEVVLATKFGAQMAGSSEAHRGRRDYVIAAVEASLRRLQTDRIDLLFMHRPDASTPIEETLRALDDLHDAGKVGVIAASNFTAAQLEDADATAKRIGVPGFAGTQDEYSLTARGVETALVPTLTKLGLGLIPYFPLGGGALSGKYRKGSPHPPGVRHKDGSDRFLEPHWDTIESLAAFAEARGRTLLELAMSWLAMRPLVVSIIAGATKPEQVEANAKSVNWRLSADEMAEVDRITAV